MKTCCACKTSLPESDFNKRPNGSCQSRCRPCQKVYYKNYYESGRKEKDRLLEKNKVVKKQIHELVTNAKSRPCTDCGIQYPPYVMDLDHLPGTEKKFNLSNARQKFSIKQVLEELDKCEVVCSNCHRIRTHSRM